MNYLGKTLSVVLACASLAGSFAFADITNPKENNPSMSRPSFSLTTATPEPTAVPAAEPTDMPAFEIKQPDQQISVWVDGVQAQDTTALQPGDHEITWEMDGVQLYSFYIYNGAGKLLKSAEQVDVTGIKLSTKAVAEDTFYTITVIAAAQDGEISRSVRLACYAETPAAPSAEPTIAPTQAPEPEATLPYLAISTPLPAATEAVMPSVGTPVIAISSPVYYQDGVCYIDGDSVVFGWSATGQVESYVMVLLDQYQNRIDLGATTSTGVRIARDQFQAGVWTLMIGAKPVGGTDADVVWASVSFGIDNALMPAENSIGGYTGAYDIEASSFRYSNNIPVYGSCAMDGDLTTAWNTEQNIEGEYLNISVKDGKAYQVAGVRIAPGYWKSSDVFKNNSRPAVIDFYCDGAFIARLELQDVKDYQTFWFDAPVTGSSFRLVIRDGYKGKKYSDCCITEIELLGPLGMQLKEAALDDWGNAVQAAERVVMDGKRIEKGDEGLYVVGLQLLLRDGFGILEGTVDGDFGSGTRNAVKELAERMQEAMPDCEPMSSGVVNEAFWRNMLAYMELL